MEPATGDAARPVKAHGTHRLLSIMIADDEAVVREGMRDRLDWAGLGFELVGAFADGRTALAAVRDSPPDVLLTDIRMPFLDGIELTRHVAAVAPHTRVLLLTGHDEFEYAQEAVRLQVWDFLLKPISARELAQVLARLSADLLAQRRKTQETERLRDQWERSLPILRERALNEFILGNEPAESVVERLQDMGVAIPTGRLRVILVSPDARAVPDLTHLELSNLVQESFDPREPALTFTTREGAVAVVYTGADGELFSRLDQLRRRIGEATDVSVTVAVGTAVGRRSDVRRSYRSAQQLLLHRFLSGGNRVITEESVPSPSKDETLDHAADRAGLMENLRNVDRAGAHEALCTLIERCRRSGQPISRCILNLQRDLARFLDLVERLDVSVLELFGQDANPFQALSSLPSLDAIQGWFAGLVDQVMDTLEARVSGQAELKVRAAQAHLAEHFRDPTLSLTRLCDDLSVSVSHFSQRFKEITGRTFVEYLTEIRIEHAKELLRSGAGKSYEIAPQVGFRDPHYFSSTFKKVCGVTPTQYRLQVAQDGGS